ncbi:hypothetical protein G4B88_000881 [Cannabis sativa]|uniref:Defensin-like domain-containing protein n=1 Tax=Cannabis sativa TaxID=3483 RepID=A0A7J6ENA2_CANSA|nr:hypothetical protein G4B88_000881 [Cannabis sativa]
MGLGLQKFLMIFVIAMAFVSLEFRCSNAGGDVVEIAPKPVNPDCFVKCSSTFGNHECIADCNSRMFSYGSCQPDNSCCTYNL